MKSAAKEDARAVREGDMAATAYGLDSDDACLMC